MYDFVFGNSQTYHGIDWICFESSYGRSFVSDILPFEILGLPEAVGHVDLRNASNLALSDIPIIPLTLTTAVSRDWPGATLDRPWCNCSCRFSLKNRWRGMRVAHGWVFRH